MGALQKKTYGILHQNHPKNFSVLPASARERDATFINHAFSPNSYGWNESSSTLAMSAHATSQKSGQNSGCGSWNPGLNLALGVSAPELLSLKSYTYIHTNIYGIYWVCITIYIHTHLLTKTYDIHLSTWTCTFYWNDGNVPQNTIVSIVVACCHYNATPVISAWRTASMAKWRRSDFARKGTALL